MMSPVMRQTPGYLVPAFVLLLWSASMTGAVVTADVNQSEAAAADSTPERPHAPANLQAKERKYDSGNTIILDWELSPDDRVDLEDLIVGGYNLYRAEVHEGEVGEFELIADTEDIPPQLTEYRDQNDVVPNQPYMYRLVAVHADDDSVYSDAAELEVPIEALRYWFDPNTSWFLVITLVVSFWIVLYIYLAKSGTELKIRRIAGLEAVDEAVGRATEMGRPILFVPGIADMNEIQTVAGLTILSRIGRLCAEYDARIEVPTRRSLVMTTARETLQSAYMQGGRPDAYHDDMSYYVTDEQFGYVAHLTVYIAREQPAAIFYLGAFFAESLILAETGNASGAIQVAGTAQPAQLPFFVAACDYTLIGEEFFAASAYLSGEPEQLGTLKGQDIGKIIGGLLIVYGVGLATVAESTDSDTMRGWVNHLMFEVLGTEDVPEELIEAQPAEEDDEGGGDGDNSDRDSNSNGGRHGVHQVPSQQYWPESHSSQWHITMKTCQPVLSDWQYVAGAAKA